MEYVEGETLRDVLRREGRLSPERAMSLTADICAALDFSHRNGIVHRDVKPGNVMITPQGTVKVMDFGIARAVSDSAATMTSTAAVIGTAQYLSPEQARGEGVDARSDVYSAGCLLYELVTGTPPFTGDSPVAVAYQHVREDPRTPSSINPAIPPELDAILLKAMSKNPANRYQSAADMRADLLRAVAGQRVEATPVMSDAEKTTIIGATPGGYGYPEDWDDDAADRKRRRNRIIALVTAVVLILAAVGIGIALTSGGSGNGRTAATRVTVPELAGKTQSEAAALITQAGLTVGTISQQPSTAQQKGTVLSSSPAGGTQADPQAPVALVIGGGPNTLPVPNLIGQPQAGAIAQLKSAGFTGSTSTDPVDSLQPKGTVVTIDPAVGSQAAPDAALRLGVSTGTISLPDVRGLTQAAAREQLISAGLDNGNIDVTNAESDTVAPGNVVSTDPGPRSPVGPKDVITLLVAVAIPSSAPTTSAPATTAPTTAATATTTTSAAG
jgi:serine/threonine-protein kinase